MGDLLQRADMPNTLLSIRDTTLGNVANPTNFATDNSYWNFTGPSRYAGGLLSCTSDMVNYLKFQEAHNTVFHVDLLSGLIPTGIDDLGKDQLYYTNGWFVLMPEDDVELVIHNGTTGGFTSFVGYNRSKKTGVVILSNSVSLTDDIGLHIIYPEFELNAPQRTTTYEIAGAIAQGDTTNLHELHRDLKQEDYPSNILGIYWLERYWFGNGRYAVSDQLSDIMVEELVEDWEVWDIKGQNLVGLRKYSEAVEAFRKRSR